MSRLILIFERFSSLTSGLLFVPQYQQHLSSFLGCYKSLVRAIQSQLCLRLIQRVSNVIFGEMFPISPSRRSIKEIGKTSMANESLTKKELCQRICWGEYHSCFRISFKGWGTSLSVNLSDRQEQWIRKWKWYYEYVCIGRTFNSVKQRADHEHDQLM